MQTAADEFQRLVYETMAHLGPVWAALCAGFAVVVGDRVMLTPAGERYLSARGIEI